MKILLVCLFELFSLVAISMAALSPELIQACKNVTVSETDVSDWLKVNAPTNTWDRPVRNSGKPISVHVKLGITSFAQIVSWYRFGTFSITFFFIFRMRKLSRLTREEC